MIIKQALYRHTAVPVIQKSLDAGALRDKAIGNNLANITSPGYQRIEVTFEKQLREALDRQRLKGTRTDPAHLPVGRKELDEVNPHAFRSKDPTKPGVINNVDVDMEAAKMAENQIGFHYAVKFMQEQRDALVSSIRGMPAS